LDAALEKISGSERLQMAGDVYSLAHFPMLFGVILYAYAVEEVVAHPVDALALSGRLALSVGLLFFVGGMAYAVRRARGVLLATRLVIVLITGVLVVAVPNVSGLITMILAFIGVLLIAFVEQRDARLAAHHEQPLDGV